MATTMLYVEDEPDDAFFMRAAFVRLGLEIDCRIAEDGPSALAYLDGRPPYNDRVSHPLPALVLLDLNLPGFSGFEVLHWIRQHPELERLPVVVLSSSGRPEDRARAGKLAANDYLIKPSSGVQFAETARHLHQAWLSGATRHDPATPL